MPNESVSHRNQIMGKSDTSSEIREIHTDENGILITKSTGSNIKDGTINVTTAGTPVQLSANEPCRSVLVRAKTTNTGIIKVGDSTPIFELSAGQAVSLGVDNLNRVYIDATVSGEGVIWLAEV